MKRTCAAVTAKDGTKWFCSKGCGGDGGDGRDGRRSGVHRVLLVFFEPSMRRRGEGSKGRGPISGFTSQSN